MIGLFKNADQSRSIFITNQMTDFSNGQIGSGEKRFCAAEADIAKQAKKVLSSRLVNQTGTVFRCIVKMFGQTIQGDRLKMVVDIGDHIQTGGNRIIL